jgi:hypothetical protein
MPVMYILQDLLKRLTHDLDGIIRRALAQKIQTPCFRSPLYIARHSIPAHSSLGIYGSCIRNLPLKKANGTFLLCNFGAP